MRTEVYQVSPQYVTAQPSIGPVTVKYDGRLFSIVNSTRTTTVALHDTSKELRGIRPEILEKALQNGSLAVSSIGDDYKIDLKTKLHGGGPLGGLLTFIGTNVAGFVMVGVGVVTTPLGIGPALIAAGSATIAAAPFAATAVTVAPTP